MFVKFKLAWFAPHPVSTHYPAGKWHDLPDELKEVLPPDAVVLPADKTPED